MDKDILLEHYQNQLDDLDQDYKSVTDKLRTETNVRTINRLQRDFEQINIEMDELQLRINDRKIYSQLQSAQIAVKSLVNLLNNYPDELGNIIQAYKLTLTHWPVLVNSEVKMVDAIITELERISPGPAYTAKDEFIAHVIHDTENQALISALHQWGQQHRAGMDWLKLHGQIITDQAKRFENAQPAILIQITRNDEASTQKQGNETYYQLNAWLIEDISTYKAQKKGYHSLIAADSPDAQPSLSEVLHQNITKILNNFMEEKERLCENCNNYPEVHVFLPLELMSWGVDTWQLKPPKEKRQAECIGHDHVVVLRCANRYESNYSKAPSWRKLWKRHQKLRKETSADVFIQGHDEDLEALIDVLEKAIQPDSNTVGLQVTHIPADIEELCYELLDSGLPLAVWQRKKLKATAKGSDWPALLSKCCLEQLPKIAQQERYQARRKSMDTHIGHHLSLLWDDPHLVPPKSA